jgi:hypothetical protein
LKFIHILFVFYSNKDNLTFQNIHILFVFYLYFLFFTLGGNVWRHVFVADFEVLSYQVTPNLMRGRTLEYALHRQLTIPRVSRSVFIFPVIFLSICYFISVCRALEQTHSLTSVGYSFGFPMNRDKLWGMEMCVAVSDGYHIFTLLFYIQHSIRLPC